MGVRIISKTDLQETLIKTISKTISNLEFQEFDKLLLDIELEFVNDQSLQGDLCHVMHFYFSQDKNKSPVYNVTSINHLTEAIENVAKAMVEKGLTRFEDVKSLNVRNIIQRRSIEPNNPSSFSAMFLALVATAVKSKKSINLNHTANAVFREIGQLRELIVAFAIELEKKPKSIDALTRKVQDFFNRRMKRRSLLALFGGMIEVGGIDPIELWQKLFNVNFDPKFLEQPSKELHYICFRNASRENDEGNKIVKSLMVIQSPGLLREHFSIKIFTRTAKSRVRKAVGSLIPLGDTLACYCTTEEVFDRFGGVVSGDGHRDFRGIKALSFHLDNFNAQHSVCLGGHFMTINREGTPVSGNIICVKAKPLDSKVIKKHEEIEIGEIEKKDLKAELIKHSTFGDIDDPDQLDGFTNEILEFLNGQDDQQLFVGKNKNNSLLV